MYTDMTKDCHSLVIDRAMALHKMIRLLTLTAGGTGYLTFMGNEFGHPEWIDFPREGNGNSFKYCRRQWSLLENHLLKYEQLNQFDHDMIHMVKDYRVLDEVYPKRTWIHEDNHVLAFERGGLVFVFNFSPDQSYSDYHIPVSKGRDYEVLFTSDDPVYGGYGRIEHIRYSAFTPVAGENGLRLYLPSRTCMVLKPAD